MLIIRCGKCKEKLLKYEKIGKGNVLYCYYNRIKKDYTILENNFVKCSRCGTHIGYFERTRMKMIQNRFYYTGHKN